MSDLQKIEKVLERTASRRRWARAWDGLMRGLFIASLVWLVVALAFKVLPIPFGMHAVAGLAALLLVVVGFLLGGWRRETSLETARWLDRRKGFKERVSAAVEFGASGAWGRILHREGARCVEGLRPGQLDPYRLPGIARWIVLVLLAGASLGFVPEYRSDSWRQARKQQQVHEDVGERLEDMSQRALERRSTMLSPTEAALVKVEELGRDLGKVRLSREDALERISSVRERTETSVRKMKDSDSMRRMQQAARESGGRTGDAQDLGRKMAELRQRMGDDSPDRTALEEMRERLDALQQAAANMNGSKGDLSREAKAGMMENLQNLQQMMSENGMDLGNLEEAIEGFRQGEFDRFIEDLDAASIDLDKMLEMARAMQNLRNRQSQLGKDLPEQLERGQAQAAIGRLEEMIRKLQQGVQDPAEMERLLAEIAEALDPSGDYGECRASLSDALQQGRQGDRAGAAASLAEAQDELRRLLEQYQDMQALLASLDALQKAQMCVGNCQGWGQCDGLVPKAGNGGKPGRGVGTWGDEGDAAWREMPQSDLWDNSGIVRPDREGRGHTDRGDGESTDDLLPTRVKGRFSSESPMPSMTLKGISIKGRSRVEIEETIAAAQTEAQSAQSQQRISRSHRAVVRNYFDDL